MSQTEAKTISELFALQRQNVVDIPATLEAIAANLRSGKLGDVEHVVIFALCRLVDGNKVCYPFQTGTASKLEAIGLVEAYKGNLLK